MVIKVCVGSACYIRGSHTIINKLKELIEKYSLEDSVELKATFCIGHCNKSVCVTVDDDIYAVSEANINDFFEETVLDKVKSCK